MNFRKTVLSGTLLIALASVISFSWPTVAPRVAYAQEAGRAAAGREQLKHARDLSTAFQDVAKALRPSVVNIRFMRKVEAPSMRTFPPGRPPDDDLLERFFGGRLPQSQEQVQRGLGSGVIVSADGYIVTNNHVVAGADTVKVVLSENQTLDAKVVGTDENTELAVVKVDAKNLVPAALGDSDAINVGEWVLAIGQPFGLSQTVTAGIVSAKGRANLNIADYEDFLQTDAAINPGNSGGPLVNLDGQVIGINTAIATRNGGYQGVGFAIPSNMVRDVMDRIIHDGKVVRGWLGIAIQPLTEELAHSFQFDGTNGALVGDVTDGGPAAKAGLQPEDIIVRIGDKPIKDINQLRNTVALTKPGTDVPVEIVRQGKHKTLSIEIGEHPGGSGTALAFQGGKNEDLGLTAQNLTPDLAKQLDLDADEKGVLVTSVSPEGPAELSGLRAKDVIVAVGNKPVNDVAAFRKAIAGYDLKDGVRLRVKTGGALRFVVLKR